MNKSLFAISPVDGRYAAKTEELVQFFSEFALIKYRVYIEIEYFLELCRVIPALKSFPVNKVAVLNKINTEFGPADAVRIKEIESVTNHDVKAVEYFLKEKFEEHQISEYKEYIHFGLTSQDINNTATPLSFKDAVENVYYPLISNITDSLKGLSNQWKNVSMLARTHGQPASPTRLGKELSVFTERIQVQLKQLQSIPWSAKFGGATGNFNAHHVAFPDVNWNEFAEKFVNIRLKLNRSYPTTQIEHYDNIAAAFHVMSRINTILLDLSRDMWTYVSMDYFKQAIKKGEVGSSAMPHKVNPIDFENAEGNLGIANALFGHLADKLPISRLQRDLTDSTVLRNIGVPFGHSIIAFNSIIRGLNKLELNQDKINQDLTDNYIVIAEAIQTVLRRENYPNPYEALKELTRTNQKVTKEIFDDFINNLDIEEEIKKELLNITPFNYTGLK